MTDDWEKQLRTKAAIARKQLGIDEEAYRILLYNRFNVESSTKLDIEQLSDLIQLYIEKYGWEPLPAKTKKPTKMQQKGKGYQGEFVEISDHVPLAGQKKYALVLAKKLGWKLSGIDTRCKKQFGVERLVWIKRQRHMQVLIKDMQNRCKKRGFDSSPQK